MVVALYIWFNTDAVPEWASLLRLRFLKYKEYAENKKASLPMMSSQSYPEFLEYQYGHKSFFVRLITCVECGTVWLNLLVSSVLFFKVGVVAFWLLGVNILACWLLYALLRWALHKLNE